MSDPAMLVDRCNRRELRIVAASLAASLGIHAVAFGLVPQAATGVDDPLPPINVTLRAAARTRADVPEESALRATRDAPVAAAPVVKRAAPHEPSSESTKLKQEQEAVPAKCNGCCQTVTGASAACTVTACQRIERLGADGRSEGAGAQDRYRNDARCNDATPDDIRLNDVTSNGAVPGDTTTIPGRLPEQPATGVSAPGKTRRDRGNRDDQGTGDCGRHARDGGASRLERIRCPRSRRAQRDQSMAIRPGSPRRRGRRRLGSRPGGISTRKRLKNAHSRAFAGFWDGPS